VDHLLSLREIPYGLAHLLHDLERVRALYLLDEDVNGILSLGYELVEHPDVLFQELFFLLFIRRAAILLDLLVLEVFDDPLHVGLLLQLGGLAYADDLIERAFVSEQLVERLQAKQADLVVLGVLDQAHDDRPKEELDDTGMLLGVLTIVEQRFEEFLVLGDPSRALEQLALEVLKGELWLGLHLKITETVAIFHLNRIY